MHDRDYYRQLDDELLIEAALISGHELAIALGERLDDALPGLRQRRRALNALDDTDIQRKGAK